MIWIILAALGVPIWLVVGMLIGALLSRRHTTRQPGVFKTKLRRHAGSVPGAEDKWRRAYALWVHDVLLTFGGVALMRTRPLPVSEVLQELEQSAPGEVKGLGESPRVMRLRLDDGSVVAVAVAGTDVKKAFPDSVAVKSSPSLAE